ncbi:MAG: sigma-70 family RNA polymerase sigma factor [Chloroflexi bacterium]|nr:sigma-70 family RNA polymerase sigma factor [Chloroflexota bacterium]
MPTEHDWLAEQFEANRGHLSAVAFRMLGSAAEADDAVQEAWLRFSGADTRQVENLGGWLTTVVARVCLDMLRRRNSRREQSLEDAPRLTADTGLDPEHEAMLGESVGLALLVVLQQLAPSERVAFVLHDMFGVPFEEIAPIVGRTPTTTRQLASRARRRVQAAGKDEDADVSAQRLIVDAFRSAAWDGDFQVLLALLDPQAVLRADAAGVAMGGPALVSGPEAVAEFVAARRARAARPALLNGAPGLVWATAGEPRVAFCFTLTGNKIAAIDLIADAESIRMLHPVLLRADWTTP